jgi:RNA polymerase sigma-70 factor (ECF subfamily)
MTGPNRTQPKVDRDYELIKAIQSGRKDMFADLVQRYERSLYSFGMKMCAEPRDAEDVVQDTFLNVYRYLDKFRYETKFKNWLYRIATSTCIKKRRKSKFAPERELSLDEFLPQDEAMVDQQIPAWATMPLDQVLNEELSRTLKQAIVEVPEKYRVVLVLRDIEGFSTEESAQILNITVANLKVRLHRARLYLREKLKTYFTDEQDDA